MMLRINAASAALVAAATHAGAEELAPLSIQGALLAFDFSHCATVEEARESIRTMDSYLGGLIADADDATEIAQLTALKRQVVGIERNVVREYQYKTRASANAEATAPDAESQLHAEQHTDITVSPDSDGAVEETETDKEVSEYGTQEEQGTEQPRRRKRRGE